MFVGHYGPGFVAKAASRAIPLWVLFVAVQFVDILWAVFVLTGVERVRIVDGFTEANHLDLYYMPYTHSLTASIGWAVLAALAYRVAQRRYRWGGSPIWVGLAVVSHWFVDLLVHVRDLPLYGNQHKVGLGLWDHLPAALAIEAVFLLGALAVYLHGVRGRRRVARRAIGVCLMLAAMHVVFSFGPPPPSSSALAAMALASFVTLAAVAYWIERPPRGSAAPG